MGADYFQYAIAVKDGGLFGRACNGLDDELEVSVAALTLAERVTEPGGAVLQEDLGYGSPAAEEYYAQLGATDSEPTSGEEAQQLWAGATVEQRTAACKSLIDAALSRADDIGGRQSISWKVASGWTVYESGGLAHGDWPTAASGAIRGILELPTPVWHAVGVALAPSFDPQEVDALAAAVQDDTMDIDTLRAAAAAVVARIHPDMAN